MIILESQNAIVNFIDDVRVFAGIVTGMKREWGLEKVSDNKVMELKDANAHFTLQVRVETDDEVRPEYHVKLLTGRPINHFLVLIELSFLLSKQQFW